MSASKGRRPRKQGLRYAPSNIVQTDVTNQDDLQQPLHFDEAQKKSDLPDAPTSGLRTMSVAMFQKLYFDQRKTLQQIGHILGVSRVAVFKWAHKNLPPSLKLRRVSKQSKYQFNEAFFDTWTPEMAYVLGVLATDGNVGKYHVCLTSTDLDLIEKVRSLIGSNHDITEKPARGWSRKIQYGLSVSSLKFVTALGQMGVTAHKSLTLRFPQMPQECVRHFLRGCWDGDGSFYIEKRRNVLKASIVSGSLQFMRGIVQALSKAGFRQRMRWKYRGRLHVRDSDEIVIHTSHRGKNPAYSIRLTGQNAVAFGRFLYDSVPELMYLKRKHDVFKRTLTAGPVKIAGGADTVS